MWKNINLVCGEEEKYYDAIGYEPGDAYSIDSIINIFNDLNR
jgi:hypothetical protein